MITSARWERRCPAMPYKRVKPATEDFMQISEGPVVLMKIREIWKITQDQEIRFKCQEAIAMAKKMHDKLILVGDYADSTYLLLSAADDSYLKKQRYVGHHSVCEKIREIWRIAEPPVKAKCKEAIAMTKHMHETLKKYR
jgi:hypothetical protein